MKNNNNFLFLFLLVSSALVLNTNAFSQARKKADKDTKNWRYEIEGVGEGKEGTYLIKVWTYSKKSNVAIEQAKKNAIHGIIFKGYTGVGRVSNQPALATDSGIEFEKGDFFDPFFDENGGYMKYINVTGDGSVAPEDVLKVNKEYKIGVMVSVKKDMLKKDLIAAGVIRSLSSGF
jgi:hypothetical protein